MSGSRTGSLPLRGGWRAISLAAMVFIAIQGSSARVFAQTNGTWNVSTSGSWNTTGNWSGGVVAGGTGATATFTNTSTITSWLQTNVALGTLITPSSRVNISGTDVAPSVQTPSSLQLQLATSSGTTPRITNAGRLDTNATITGTQGFTKSGAGTFYLWGTNTYTGTTIISTGQIYLRNPYGLGATGAGNGTVVQSGATLRIDASFTTDVEPLTISGSGASNLGALRTNTAGTDGNYAGPITLAANSYITAAPSTAITLSGAVSLGSNSLTLGDSGGMTISGAIDGTGNVDYVGGGSLVLSGFNTFSGTMTVTNTGPAVAMNGYLTGPMNFTGVSGRNLIGTGTFAGGVKVAANTVLAPGATSATDYGTLTASRLEVQSATVQLGIQDSSTYDRLVMTAGSTGLTLGGTANLVLDFAGELASSTLNLLSFTGLSGGFGGVTSTGFYAGTWTGSSGVWTLANVGTGGAQTLTYTQSTGVLAIVPEPSTLALLGGSALVVASRLRLRRRTRELAK